MDRILLTEDDAGAQLLFRNRLEELGYEVVCASTGARGLMEARAGKFDLFLVDIGLGSGIDGYEVCRRLKAMPQNHRVPVVLISSLVKSQDELHRGYEAGCEAFLVKGDLTLIEDVVRAMLRIKSLQDDLALQNRLLEEQNRRLNKERERGADLERALRETGNRAVVFRELATGRPDGVLWVDAEGVVRGTDRGAQDVLGKDIEGKHLARLAPGTGLEAFVRNARTATHDGYRLDVGDGSRSLSVSVLPMVPSSIGDELPYRVVILHDQAKRRVAAEMLRLEEHGVPRREIGPLVEAARSVFHPDAMVGPSNHALELRRRLEHLARSDRPVLIRGETGAGKQFAARILHFAGADGGPLVPVDCAALTPELLENELFGYTKDAVPDALADRPGIFQQAHNGTVFLHGIEALPPALQTKLAETLRTRSVKRQGAHQSESIQVRVLASTTAPPEELVNRGFDPVLLEELAGEELYLPALRERRDDVLPMAGVFLRRFGAGRALEFAPEVVHALRQYGWPGNVRELESTVEGACQRASGSQVMLVDLPHVFQELGSGVNGGEIQAQGSTHVWDPASPDKPPPFLVDIGSQKPSLLGYEKLALLHALQTTKGDKISAARLLGIGKSTFYRKLKQHKIDP